LIQIKAWAGVRCCSRRRSGWHRKAQWVSTLHEHVSELLRQHLDAPGALPDRLNNALRVLAKYR